MKTGDVVNLDVKVQNQDGKEIVLKDYLDKRFLVLYFYPKDNTPGCTTQACTFRDYSSELEKLGVRVVGVSKDSPKSHLKFIEKKSLNFELISDESLELHKAFEVWVEKSMFGKKYMGAQRSTFLIGSDGKVLQEWRDVKPAEDAKNVVEFLEGFE